MSKSISGRTFLFDDEDQLHFVPRRVVNGLLQDTDRTPQFANQRLRVAMAMVRLTNGVPIDLARVEAYHWIFDDRGSPYDAFVAEMDDIDWIDGPGENKKVVSIERLLAQRRRRARKWHPSSRDITRIVHAIWPEQAGGKAIEKPQRVQGLAKRKYPMSYEAKDAARKCSEAIHEITWVVGELGEHGLKGVISDVEQRHGLSQDDRFGRLSRPTPKLKSNYGGDGGSKRAPGLPSAMRCAEMPKAGKNGRGALWSFSVARIAMLLPPSAERCSRPMLTYLQVKH